MRTSTFRPTSFTKPKPRQTTPRPQSNKPFKSCPLCKQVGRSDSLHFLSECPHLPEGDHKYIARARQVASIFEEDDSSAETFELACTPVTESNEPSALRVQIHQSPYLDAFHGHHASRIIIDSGATGNLIRNSTAIKLGVKISKSSQWAHQADGSFPPECHRRDQTIPHKHRHKHHKSQF